MALYGSPTALLALYGSPTSVPEHSLEAERSECPSLHRSTKIRGVMLTLTKSPLPLPQVSISPIPLPVRLTGLPGTTESLYRGLLQIGWARPAW